VAVAKFVVFIELRDSALTGFQTRHRRVFRVASFIFRVEVKIRGGGGEVRRGSLSCVIQR
jgi:hypothetical protein